MTTLTVRLPEGKHERLKVLAKSRNMSVNKLIAELVTVALANHDAFLRFQSLARQGTGAGAARANRSTLCQP